ncbi:MAG TPA: hypothetical protein VK395_20035 [Gemmataceae bacterium]|nr:hypothetical protein [Gemmataceae bacterium]
MANKMNGVADPKAGLAVLVNGAAATAPTASGSDSANTNEAPLTIGLRARVRGEVAIRLRVIDPRYTAEKIARLLNQGNPSWDVGRRARYYQIEKNGHVIAEIEYADEDTHWERYEVE